MRFTLNEYFCFFASGAVRNIWDRIAKFAGFSLFFVVSSHYAVQVKSAAGTIARNAADTG